MEYRNPNIEQVEHGTAQPQRKNFFDCSKENIFVLFISMISYIAIISGFFLTYYSLAHLYLSTEDSIGRGYMLYGIRELIAGIILRYNLTILKFFNIK